jgi:hypothetical protein
MPDFLVLQIAIGLYIQALSFPDPNFLWDDGKLFFVTIAYNFRLALAHHFY